MRILFFILFFIFQTNIFALFFDVKRGDAIIASFFIAFFLLPAILVVKKHFHFDKLFLKYFFFFFLIILTASFFSSFEIFTMKYLLIMTTAFISAFICSQYDIIKNYLLLSIGISISNILFFIGNKVNLMGNSEKILFDGNHYRNFSYNLLGSIEGNRVIWFFGEPTEYVQFITPAIILAMFFKKNIMLHILFIISMMITFSSTVLFSMIVIILYYISSSNIKITEKIILFFFIVLLSILLYPEFESYLKIRFIQNDEFSISRIDQLLSFFEGNSSALNNFIEIYRISKILFLLNATAQLLVIYSLYLRNKEIYQIYILFFLFVTSFVRLNAVETIFYWVLVIDFFSQKKQNEYKYS